jgi:hypothetical protein
MKVNEVLLMLKADSYISPQHVVAIASLNISSGVVVSQCPENQAMI